MPQRPCHALVSIWMRRNYLNGVNPLRGQIVQRNGEEVSEANDLKRRRRGLFDKTHKLMGEGRLRTALEKVFAFLDHHPNDEYALLVATVIADRTRTSLISAKEPIPPEHLNDIRLDSIFAVCGNCEKSWISGDVFPWSANVGKLNPVGLQC